MSNIFSTDIRTLVPLSAFLLLFVLQFVRPRRDFAKSGSKRIFHNLFLFLINSAIMRILVPLSLLISAQWAAEWKIGLFNSLQISSWVSLPICIIVLDFAVYWQHVVTHKIGWLWRLHRVHHADQEMDTTTAIRFHPIELVLSLLYKAGLVILLGAPAVAVIVFELLLFVGPAFNHSNLKIPPWLESRLRWVIATPDLHRAHHSSNVSEQNTNYGFFLIWWDRLFATYTAQPQGGHIQMKIGLADPHQACERVDQMLLAPFR